MNLTWIVPIVVFIITLILYDRKNWKSKPTDDFVNMLLDDDYQGWRIGLTEMRKRGVDIEPYLPMMLGRLLSTDVIAREQARGTIAKNFPELKQELKAFRLLDDAEASKELVETLHKKYCST